MSSGVQDTAHHRAQLLPLGLSAFNRRIVSPSPGRDCFLSANARGCFYRTWRIGGGGGPVSHTLAASALCTWTRSTDRRVVCFSSGRPTRIVFRIGPADSYRVSARPGDSNHFSVQVGRPTRVFTISVGSVGLTLCSVRLRDASVVCWLRPRLPDTNIPGDS